MGSSSAHLMSILVSPCSRRKCAPFDGGGGGGGGIIMRSRGPASLGPPGPGGGGGGGGGASALGPAPGGGGGGGGASACWPASGPPGGGGGGCWANVDPAARRNAAPAIISFFMRETSVFDNAEETASKATRLPVSKNKVQVCVDEESYPIRSDAYEPGLGGKTTVRLPLMKVRWWMWAWMARART